MSGNKGMEIRRRTRYGSETVVHGQARRGGRKSKERRNRNVIVEQIARFSTTAIPLTPICTVDSKMRRKNAWSRWFGHGLVVVEHLTRVVHWRPSNTIIHLGWTEWKVAVISGLTVTSIRRVMLIVSSTECGSSGLLTSGAHNWRVRNPANISLMMRRWLSGNEMICGNLRILAPRGGILS